MRRSPHAPSPAVAALAVVAVLALPACQLGGGADPDRDSATVSETLPDDAGDLENPGEVVSPGGGAGETAGETTDGTPEPAGDGGTGDSGS